uniref:Uncharacterized protein n=1 Tax=Megaselia scalaris TaxID=36166 RepID=T1GAQ8_MEGSC
MDQDILGTCEKITSIINPTKTTIDLKEPLCEELNRFLSNFPRILLLTSFPDLFSILAWNLDSEGEQMTV